MRWVGCIGTASENGQDGTQALRPWLGDAEDVEIAYTRRTKVGGAVHIEVEVKGTT
jgi:hypothetical protein